MKQRELPRLFWRSCSFGAALWVASGVASVVMSSAAQAASVVSNVAEPIAAEEAFQSQARFKDAKTLEVEFKIADGYYLYRKRFQFAPVAEGLKLGKAQTPPGKMKQDATFGRVETYRKSVRVLLSIAAVDKADKEIRFKVTSQGCADIGVCYPPMKQEFVLKKGDTVAVNALPGLANPLSAPLGAPSASPTTTQALSKPAAAPGSIADLIKRVP
jgi:thioredoxin:protein disulfide reductase